jgi:hypothetical protein
MNGFFSFIVQKRSTCFIFVDLSSANYGNLVLKTINTMIYQLPNGKSVEMSTEQYFRMTDEDFQFLVASNAGDEINDPFSGSVLRKPPIIDKTTPIEEMSIEDLTEDELEELGEIIEETVYIDTDFMDLDSLEQ